MTPLATRPTIPSFGSFPAPAGDNGRGSAKRSCGRSSLCCASLNLPGLKALARRACWILCLSNPRQNSIRCSGSLKTGIGAGLLKVDKLDPDHLEESEIDLTVFTSWANTTGLTFPEGFPWQPEMNLQITNWPWGRYETNLLRKLARATDLFWKSYDPADPSSAPNNEQVIEWLMGSP